MNMAFARVLRRICLLFLIVGIGSPLLAQNIPTRPPSSSSGSSSVNLDFKVDESLGTTFYVDMIGLESSKLPFSPEVRVDASTYIVGPQDLIGVIITGTFSLNYRALGVNIEGNIFLPSIGTVQVAGKSLLEARVAIKDAVEKQYRNVAVDVMLDKPRPLTVHVSGDVPYPGRVSLPYGTRLDTPLMGALLELPSNETSGTNLSSSISKTLSPSSNELPGFSSAGISDLTSSGSATTSIKMLLDTGVFNLRSIRVTRMDGSVILADLHDYYYGGNLDANPILRDGDQVQIVKTSVADARVSLSGAVYSAVDVQHRGDDTFGRLLRMTGGFTSNADTTSVSIYRSDASGTRLVTVDLRQPNARNTLLVPNDRVVVGERSTAYQNARATIMGRAKSSGIYPISDGTTTAFDVLAMAGGLEPDALVKGAYISRRDPIASNASSPGQPDIAQLIRSSDQYLQGLSWFELEEKARKNRIYLDVSNEQSLRSIRMYDGDSLFIPRDERTVFVYGQVNNPGFVEHNTNFTLDDYINSMGGYSLSANQKKVYVIKAGTKTWTDARNTTVESGDWIYVDREPLDDLAQQRLYDLQKQGFRLQRQGLYTAAFTALVSAVSTTVAILIYYKN
jgi:polysaccharide export outer membrane protein